MFELTPTMSSYLTAICAGPYAEWHTEYANEDGRTVPMAMYCRQALAKAFSKDVDYLFDITKKGFAFYAKTWGVPYPYAKFDQIYVPDPRSPTPMRNAVWSPCCTSSPTCGSATT